MTSRIDVIGQNGNDGEHYDTPVIKCNFKAPGQLCGKMKVKIGDYIGELCSLPMGECDCQEIIKPEPVLVGEAGTGTTEQEEPDHAEIFTQVIEFAIETDEPKAFLTCWLEGDFTSIKNEWPEFKGYVGE